MMPFPNESLAKLRMAILRCELAFEGRYWEKVTPIAKSFVRTLIHADQKTRPSASEALSHPWLSISPTPDSSDEEDEPPLRSRSGKVARLAKKSIPDLPGLRENLNAVARARWRIAIGSAIAVNRLREGGAVAGRRRTRTEAEERERSRSRSRARSAYNEPIRQSESAENLKELARLVSSGILSKNALMPPRRRGSPVGRSYGDSDSGLSRATMSTGDFSFSSATTTSGLEADELEDEDATGWKSSLLDPETEASRKR